MRGSGDDVVTSVTANTLEAVEALGWPVRPDWTAAGVDVARLRVPRGWVSWDEYLRLLCTLARDEGEAVALGTLVVRHGARGPLRHFGRLADGARPLFGLVFGRMMRSTVRVVEPTVADLGAGRLRVHLALDPARAPGEVFFRVVEGTMRGLPGLCGAPDALVRATIGSHEATYDVQLAPGVGLWSRLARAGRLVVGRDDASSTAVLMARVEEAVQNLHDAEVRLGEAEERWRQLASGVPGLVVVADDAGVVVDVHGAAARPAGLAPGRPWPDVFAAGDRAAVAAQLDAGGDGAPIEVRVDGEPPMWWACRAAPLAGSPPRRVVVAVDVTERRRSEEARAEAERRYLHAQKLDAIGRLSGGLAHDVNNVLTALLANTDLLEMAVAGTAAAGAGRPSLEGIRAAVGRASALTRRLLASGRVRPVARACDLGALCREAQGVLGRLVGESVTLRVEVPPAPCRVALGEDRVEQILLNLVINARDAVPRGGTIVVRVEPGDDLADLVVADDGIGMPPEVLSRATEPFFTTKPVGLGSGLGLSTVAELVAEVGGALAIDSAPGRGTTVRVSLLRADADEEVGELAAPEPGARGGGRLLLVEDQDDLRTLLAQSLEHAGYAVFACAEGESALRLFRADPGAVDLVITDLVMPGPSGREVAAAVRAARPTLPVLLMSGYAATDAGPIAGPGPVEFLSKPFRPSVLADTVAALLDRKARSDVATPAGPEPRP